MADITNLFKATVKTVKARQKSQGNKVPVDKSILGTKRKSDFSLKANEVAKNITKLKDFLLENRKDYINAMGHELSRDNCRLTDADRDQIDAEAEKIIKICNDSLKTFKLLVKETQGVAQVKQHRNLVIELLQFYLKGVCKIYSEQKAFRVKRVVDRKRISRLEPEHKKLKKDFHTPNGFKLDELSRTSNPSDSSADNDQKARVPSTKRHQPMFTDDSDVEEDLSEEEQEQLLAENEQLYEEMNSVVDEVKQIEGKVVEISRLQEIFGEKVLEQEKDISRIAESVVGTSENIKDANEEIREAMKNNAGLRVWILFFIIVMSLSLLFLDWYNP